MSESKYYLCIRKSLAQTSLRAWLTILLLTLSASVHAQSRTALVIGNSDYQSIAALDNPAKDARSMSIALRSVGFEVIAQFGNKLNSGGVGLFFFAGHGVNVSKSNYIIPVKANIDSETQVPYKAVNVDLILDTMRNAGNPLNLVILDACRNNPFAGESRSASRGLTRLPTPKGTLIAYATAEGQTAEDGSGENGTYTKHILEQMMSPDLPVELMFKNVREGVRKETGGRQTPMEQSSLIGHFSFVSRTSEAENAESIVEKIDIIRLSRPVTESMIDTAIGLYDQLESRAETHPELKTRSANLSKLHERYIRHQLSSPEQALNHLGRINKRFHDLSLLSPEHPILLEKDRLLAAAFIYKAEKVYLEGRPERALSLINEGLKITNDPRLVRKRAFFQDSSLSDNGQPSSTNTSVLVSNPVVASNMAAAIQIRYQNNSMNCRAEGDRFEKIYARMESESSGKLRAKEYLVDACSANKWLYIETKKTHRSAKKLCSGITGDWRLPDKQELLSLITEERYPGQGGMMGQDFFPSNNATGPQEVYWSGKKEGGKYLLVNAMNGTIKDTYNASTIGSVICVGAK